MAKLLRRPDTAATHGGHDPFSHGGAVNPPVYHTSTILFENADTLHNLHKAPMVYGRYGTPTTAALEDLMLELECAEEGALCRLAPSGHAAMTEVMLAYAHAGGHMLVADGVYGPTRQTCDQLMKRMGVETTYYDPSQGAGIADLIRNNTQLIILETPASRTFEMLDVPAIAGAARERGVITALDNTWATPFFFKPLTHGVDVSVCAGTKFLGGHSDLLIGTITARKEAAKALYKTHMNLGQHVGPDDVNLTIRGIRTLPVRMRQHMASGLKIAAWLQTRPDIACVMYPALPEDPGHEVWRRDFKGASGVFGFEMTTGRDNQADAFMNALDIIGLGYSFGGFESLLVPTDVRQERTAVPVPAHGPMFRLHVGLEDVDDLIADLEKAFTAYHAAG